MRSHITDHSHLRILTNPPMLKNTSQSELQPTLKASIIFTCEASHSPPQRESKTFLRNTETVNSEHSRRSDKYFESWKHKRQIHRSQKINTLTTH